MRNIKNNIMRGSGKTYKTLTMIAEALQFEGPSIWFFTRSREHAIGCLRELYCIAFDHFPHLQISTHTTRGYLYCMTTTRRVQFLSFPAKDINMRGYQPMIFVDHWVEESFWPENMMRNVSRCEAFVRQMGGMFYYDEPIHRITMEATPLELHFFPPRISGFSYSAGAE